MISIFINMEINHKVKSGVSDFSIHTNPRGIHTWNIYGKPNLFIILDYNVFGIFKFSVLCKKIALNGWDIFNP